MNRFMSFDPLRILLLALFSLLPAGCLTNRPAERPVVTSAAAAVAAVAADGSEVTIASAPAKVPETKKNGTREDELSSLDPLIPSAVDSLNALHQIPLPSRNLEMTEKEPHTYSLSADMTKGAQTDEKKRYDLVTDHNDILEIIDIFSKHLEFQYYVDPAVKGSVTMQVTTELTPKEAWDLFEHILWLNGAYATKHSGFVSIYPFAKMPEERRLLAKHDPIPNVTVELIRLKYTTPAEITALIKPFMTQGATAMAVKNLNSLLVVEAPPNMEKLRELIHQLDVIGETQWPQFSLPVRHIDADLVVEELLEILPVLGFSVTTSAQGDGKSVKIVALQRLQVIIASAPTDDVLKEIQKWVKILDREDTGEQERVFFYSVKYNQAESLSEAINVFFEGSEISTASAANTTGSSATSGSNRSTTSSRTPISSTSGRSSTNRLSSSNRNANQDEHPRTVFDIPVKIFSDGNHNRLVIRTTPRAYAMLEALLLRLDTPPLQVAIQVTIAEVSLKKTTNYGLTKVLSQKWGGDRANVEVNNDGVTFKLGPNLDAVDALTAISANDSVVDTRVLFRPQIIGISDKESSFEVGDKISVITSGDFNETISTTARNNYSYLQTGTSLKVTPHITAKRMVTLEIQQERSQSTKSQNTDNPNPDISNRSVSTTLIAQDGELILLAGLISADQDKTESGIPYLRKIPLVGKLLGGWENKDNATELLMLIKVNVLDTDSDHQKLLQRYEKAIGVIGETFGDAQ